MAPITSIHNPWRDALLPASFRGALFHVEASSKENARRIVVHEFPKREEPYSEDMGRRAVEFTVRGYCIQYVRDEESPLYRRDYRISRDLLMAELQKEGQGVLQLPLLPPMTVVCPRYRLTEEERLGGYCTFDMSFVEFGIPPPYEGVTMSRDLLIGAADNATQQTVIDMNDSKAVSEAAGAGGITFPGGSRMMARRPRA